MVLYSESYWKDVAEVVGVIPNKSALYNHTILITGATGMICSAVVDVLHWMNDHLDANINIILAGRSEERTRKRFPFMEENEYISFVPYDATSSDRINFKADYIIHGASNADPASFTKQPVETMLANIVGLNALLRSAAENDTKRVLLISSSEVYGRKEERRPYEESDYGYVDILNPRASYPSSKRAAETLCAAYKEEHGLDFVVIRPGHIYGPSITKTDSRASAQFTRNAKAGKDIVMKSAGTQLRSYCYTLDCASAILTALLNGNNGEAYNISGKGIVCSIRDIAEALAKAGNVKVLFENASETEKKGFNLMDNSSLDGTKLESLGWRSLFDITTGTGKTLSYYEEQA